MKIVHLTAENFKKLRAVEIAPAGEIVTIAGRNGAGKSSTLDAIWATLAGAEHIQAQPIRKGETKARIKLDLGEITVERRFTEKGSTVTVESAEGARFPSPQKMLDALIGELSFDPLAFARMDPRAQFNELRKVSKLELDIDNLDALNKGDYAKRTDLNRDAKGKRVQAEAIVVASDLPAEPLDEAALLTEMETASEKNTLIERGKQRRAETMRGIAASREQAKQMREEAATLRQRADEIEQRAGTMEATADRGQAEHDALPALPEPVDVAAVRVKLEHARQVNGRLAERARRTAIEAEALDLEKQAQALTEKMEQREAVKATAIAAAKMPVPGLGFGDGIVTYNGVPFDQASTAEQLRVSLSIAMAANPKLRVILIKDGSLLDSDSKAAIAAMAKDQDYQVWIETVDTSGSVGVVIEDGAVIAVDGAPVTPKDKTAKVAA